MPDLSAYLSEQPAYGAGLRAETTARHIDADPTSIVVQRAGSNLSAQTVRLEAQGYRGEMQGENALPGTGIIVVIGYKNHASIADTNIQRGDQFFVNDTLYDVVDVVIELGSRLVATAKARK